MNTKKLPPFLENLLRLKEELKEDQELREKITKPFKIILDSQKRQLRNNKQNWTKKERGERNEEIEILETFLEELEK